MKVTFLKVAESEFDDAIEYYESEQFGLGARFRKEILLSLGRIVKYPTAYQPLSIRTRRCLVAKFPFGIIYQIKTDTNEVLVVAVAHLHRRPDYWVSRRS